MVCAPLTIACHAPPAATDTTQSPVLDWRQLLDHFETAEAIFSNWSTLLSKSLPCPCLPPTPPSQPVQGWRHCWVIMRQLRQQSSQNDLRPSQNRCSAPPAATDTTSQSPVPDWQHLLGHFDRQAHAALLKMIASPQSHRQPPACHRHHPLTCAGLAPAAYHLES
jgi:hypothetical protein